MRRRTPSGFAVAALAIALSLPAGGRAVADEPGVAVRPPRSGSADAVDRSTLEQVRPGLTIVPRRAQRAAAAVGNPPQRAASSGTAASPETWSELPPPVRAGALGVYDPAADRFLVCGGYDFFHYRFDVWSLDLAHGGEWTRVATAGTRGDPYRIAANAVDPVHGRAFFFGTPYGGPIGEVDVVDLFGAPTWRRIVPSNVSQGPVAWQSATAIYDSRRDRLVLFGGFGRDFLSDAWSFDLATVAWSIIAAGGDSTRPGIGALSVYDPDRDRMLLLGGDPARLWVLGFGDSPAWHFEIVGGDSVGTRFGTQLVHDPADGSILLLGGGSWPDYSGAGDVFRLEESPVPAWRRIQPAGSPARMRFSSAVAYDSQRDRFLFYGGSANPVDRLDVDALSLRPTPEWSTLGFDSLPAARLGQAMVVDSRRDRLMIFGGVSADHYLGDVWTAPLENPEQWSALATSGTPPPPRHEPVAVYDPLRDRMVTFGGWTYPDTYFGDTWVLSLDPLPTWTQAQPEGEPPPGRRAHAAVHDPLRDRMLVFYGYGVDDDLDDVWALDLADPMRWERLQPTGPGPRARAFPSVVYDPTRDRVVLYGGAGPYSLGDSWALSLADLRWELLDDGSSAPQLERHTAVYDLSNDRMVVMGGWAVDYDVLMSIYGVTLDLAFEPVPHWTWSAFEDMPSPRVGHTAAFDPRRSRMAVFGGGDLGAYQNDSWLLDFGTGRFGAWLIASSTAGNAATLVWQAASDAPFSVQVERSSFGESWHVVGSVDPDPLGRVTFHDVGVAPGWVYRYRLAGAAGPISAETQLVTSGTSTLRMLGAWPNPVAGSDVTIHFALGSSAPATFEIFDLTGRRLWREELTSRHAGVTSLKPRASWRPGIYVVRVVQDGRAVTGKLCVLR